MKRSRNLERERENILNKDREENSDKQEVRITTTTITRKIKELLNSACTATQRILLIKRINNKATQKIFYFVVVFVFFCLIRARIGCYTTNSHKQPKSTTVTSI